MADLAGKLDELVEMVTDARSMPLSASVLVHRGELVALVEEIRALLPSELSAASEVLADRRSVVAEGRREADEIIAAAQADRARLVSKTEVAQAASREAEVILAQARASADQMRAEVEDYVDGKLANFEVVLHKTLAAVEKGRAKLRGRHELADLAAEPLVVGGDDPVDGAAG